MKRLFKNKKGMTLVTVMIIMTVLVLLCAILAETVMQNIVLTKRHRNVDLAYYAGESAIENWISVIESKICNNLDIGAGYGSVNLSNDVSMKDYAEYIVNKIHPSDLKTQQIDIEGKTPSVAAVPVSSSATVVAKPLVIEGVEKDSSSGNAIIIKLGIKAEASYSSASAYSTANKVVYAVKPFKVYCPKVSELEGPIYTVGDFYINNSKVKVKGDVFTFGSYTQVKSTAQHYYGGIYAKNNSKLEVFGNAYSRSFIRAGQYLEKKADGTDILDNTDIFIYKDGIAQCIQSFGHKDRIAILRNAYTFDDLEINGNNSIIAVNGSFFGLANGSGRFHDDSSAIVNSATVHQQLNPNSFKSRVSINGDAFIGGSTVKVATTGLNIGESIGEIEAASLAFIDEDGASDGDTDGMPYYKFWSDWDKITAIPPQAPPEKYHDDLKQFYNNNSDKFNGKFNQIQLFPIFNPLEDALPGVIDTKIQNWLTDIENFSYASVPPQIQGISEYEIVANDMLYIKPNGGTESNITKYNNLYVNNTSSNLGLYKLDNIFDGNDPEYYGNECWDMTKYEKELGVSFEDTHDDFLLFLYGSTDTEGGRGGLCGEIYKKLLEKTNKFAYRDYLGDVWDTSEKGTEFNRILNAITSKPSSKYLLKVDSSVSTGEHDINDLFSDIYTKCSDSRAGGFVNDKEYFVIANPYPEVDLKISGSFNGIIVTTGKVILENGASVYGSIIAAGDGDYKPNAEGEPEFIPKAKEITDSEYEGLNNGEYAALFVKDTNNNVSVPPPYVDFFLGLAGDANTPLNESHIIDIVEEARKTTRGILSIPELDDAVALERDKKMVYLNKAARINLLEKFLNKGPDSIDLYDIF